MSSRDRIGAFFWARSSLESQIPLQRALNILVSSEVDNIDSMAHMKWGLPTSANVADIWNTNEVVEYEGSVPPAMLKVESWGAILKQVVHPDDL